MSYDRFADNHGDSMRGNIIRCTGALTALGLLGILIGAGLRHLESNSSQETKDQRRETLVRQYINEDGFTPRDVQLADNNLNQDGANYTVVVNLSKHCSLLVKATAALGNTALPTDVLTYRAEHNGTSISFVNQDQLLRKIDAPNPVPLDYAC